MINLDNVDASMAIENKVRVQRDVVKEKRKTENKSNSNIQIEWTAGMSGNMQSTIQMLKCLS